MFISIAPSLNFIRFTVGRFTFFGHSSAEVNARIRRFFNSNEPYLSYEDITKLTK